MKSKRNVKQLAAKKTKSKTTLKKEVKKSKPKAEIKKRTKKVQSKPKKTVTVETLTVIKKTFDQVNLISHPFTAPNDHPAKIKTSKLSVSEINGIGGSTFSKFSTAGIKTVEDFVNAGVTGVSKTLGWTEKGGLPFYLRGLAVYHNRIIKIKELKKDFFQSNLFGYRN